MIAMFRFSRSFSVTASFLLIIIPSGCTRKTAVQEITVVSSGIEVRETNRDLTTEWPGWRGPFGDGHAVNTSSDQTRFPTHWSETQGVLWMSEVPGRGHGSPTVVGNRVFLATADDRAETQSVLAYDRATGELIWNKEVNQGGFPSASQQHPKGSNANSTVACDGERVFMAFLNHGKITATALDLEGSEVWTTELGAFNSKFGYAPSPVIYKSLVIFACDNQGGGYLAAVDSETGQLAWRVGRAAKNSHSSPLVAKVGNRDQLLLGGCEQVCSYAPDTGQLLWSTNCLAETTCGTIVVHDNFIFAAGGYPEDQVVCLDADGKLVWSNRTKVYEPSLIAVDGSLYAANDRGIAYCWNAADGEMRWQERMGGGFSASPVFYDGNLMVSDLSGRTHVFRASSDAFEEVAVNALGSDCYASPAVVGGHLFFRVGFGSGPNRQEKLVCVGE